MAGLAGFNSAVIIFEKIAENSCNISKIAKNSKNIF